MLPWPPEPELLDHEVPLYGRIYHVYLQMPCLFLNICPRGTRLTMVNSYRYDAHPMMIAEAMTTLETGENQRKKSWIFSLDSASPSRFDCCSLRTKWNLTS